MLGLQSTGRGPGWSRVGGSAVAERGNRRSRRLGLRAVKDDHPGQARPRAPRNRQAEGPCAKLSLGLKREASAGGTQRCSCPSRWGVRQNGVQSEATRDPTEKREMPQGMSTCLERGCGQWVPTLPGN